MWWSLRLLGTYSVGRRFPSRSSPHSLLLPIPRFTTGQPPGEEDNFPQCSVHSRTPDITILWWSSLRGEPHPGCQRSLGDDVLAQIHKKSPFYLDISYRGYKQHLTIVPLLPTGDGLGLCGYTKNFAIGALHWRPDIFGKGGEIISWAPPAFRKAAPGELVLITRSGSKTWGYTGLVPERHGIPMAPLDSLIQLGLDNAREAILPDYAFALCIPGSWPFPSSMDKTILPESYFSEGNPVEEDANTTTVAKKTHKHKGRKTQNRSKSAGTASSASEASLARAKTATQTDEERVKQVIQDLHLSSNGSDSEVPDDTGNPPKGRDSENSGSDPQGPSTAPDQEPSNLPGIPSGDQLPDNGQDNPVPPQPDANTLDLDASASDPLPKLVHPPGLPSPTSPDSSTTPTPGLLPGAPLGQDLVTGFPHVPTGDQFMTPLTHTAAHAGGNPHAYSFTGIIEGLKEVCSLMATGFQRACLDVEAIVQKMLEEATRLNRDFTMAAAQDLDKWTTALWPVLDNAGVSDSDMEARQRHARQTRREVSNQILSLLNPMVAGPPTQVEPVRTTLLESFAIINVRCSSSWKEVADRILDIMVKHVPAGQAQVFLNVIYQLLCTQYQAITNMVVAQTGPPVRSGMHNWATQTSLTRLLTQVVPALGSLQSSKPVFPSGSTQIVPQHQEEGITRAASADMTIYTPIPPDGCVMVPKGQYPSSTVWGSSSLPIYLGNETDSGISSVGHSTPVKSSGAKQQHLTSTPKSQPKFISVTQQQMAKLSANWQGAPHGAHVKHDRGGSAQVNSWGNELRGWSTTCPNQAGSFDSSIVSINNHTQLTTKHLMERDDPTQNPSAFSGGEEVMSVHDSSDI